MVVYDEYKTFYHTATAITALLLYYYSWTSLKMIICTSCVALVVYLFYLVIGHDHDNSFGQAATVDCIPLCTAKRSNLHEIQQTYFMYWWLRTRLEQTHLSQKKRKLAISTMRPTTAQSFELLYIFICFTT